MPDIKLHIDTEYGATHNIETPSDLNTGEFLREVLEGLEKELTSRIPHSREYIRSTELWSLEDEGGRRTLLLDKTLSENGVRNNSHLLLRFRLLLCPECGLANNPESQFCRNCGYPFKELPPVPPKTIRLRIHREDGSLFSDDVDGTTLVGVFIARQLSRRPKFSIKRAEQEAPHWIAHDKDEARDLDPEKSLEKNGVRDGHHLYLRRTQPPPPRTWWKVAAALAILAVLGFAGYHFLRPQIQRSLNNVRSKKDSDNKPSTPRHTPIIEISPEKAELHPSETVNFKVEKDGVASTNAKWAEPLVGAITEDGTYKAPADVQSEQRVEITGTIDGISATAVVNLHPAAQPTATPTPAAQPTATPTPTPTTSSTQNMAVLPATAMLDAGATRQFRVNPDPGAPVHWSVNPSIGSISSNGVYTAPQLVSSLKDLTISTDLPNSLVAKVTLQPVTITAACTDGANGTKSCAANVRHTAKTGVVWSVTPKTGDISSQGIYTPANPKTPYDVVITATSTADPAKYATVQLHIIPPKPHVTVTINRYNPLVTNNQVQRFSAVVTGDPNTSVTWSMTGVGLIMPDGLYVPPHVSPLGDYTIHVTATSNADSRQRADATFTWRHGGYSGPLQGTLIWRGNISNNQLLKIVGSQVSTGSLDGAPLPGVPVELHIDTPRCVLLSIPAAANGWKEIQIRTGAHLHEIIINWQVRQ